MTTPELNKVINLSCEDRYEYFLSMTGEEREIWILVDSQNCFLKIHTDEDGGFEYLPVWPSSEFANTYAESEAGLTPKSIPLPQFLKKWLPGLSKDNIEIGVFPAPDKSVWITGTEALESDLRDELDNF
ncbi:DUF2750 domain-containing protein [Microbulbifer sp. THAF38]|uniref:DUF2750 domain-containing protein n=1 Tax=Microbulbifer sp. THAF38 TaxID=2587856 RepID=UPI0012690E06|nr:DUF2750 domain-containing protein [Microbulbifer sp. THAF38]QFT55879.1 hypothetical protein FIU95_15110 [Microbulbifer sp. THAF38]